MTRGRLLAATALLVTLVTLGTAAPASAEPAPTGKNDVGAQAMDVFNCYPSFSDPRALCTTPNARVNMRGQPNTNSVIVTTLTLDTFVWLHCWTAGESIHGDAVWYYVTDYVGGATNPVYWPQGWVAGYYLNTGPDPHPWVGHC